MGLGLGRRVPVELGLELLGERRGDLDVRDAVACRPPRAAARARRGPRSAGRRARSRPSRRRRSRSRRRAWAHPRAPWHPAAQGWRASSSSSARGWSPRRRARRARTSLARRLRRRRRRCTRRATRSSSSRAGAIARGMRVMGLGGAPDRDRGPPGGQRGRAGQALPGLRRAAARARPDERPGAADVLRRQRPGAVPQRPPDAARLLDWRVVPVVNENDTTATDEISFGDNDFLAAQIGVLVGADLLVLLTDVDGLHTADPRPTRPRGASTSSRAFEALEGLESGTPPRRWARAGCARRSSPPRWPRRPGIAAVVCNGLSPPRSGPPWRGGAAGRASGRGGPLLAFKLWLQATPSPRRRGPRRRRRRPRAARRRHVACCRSGSSTSAAAFDAGDAVRGRAEGGALSARASPTTRPPSCAGSRA